MDFMRRPPASPQPANPVIPGALADLTKLIVGSPHNRRPKWCCHSRFHKYTDVNGCSGSVIHRRAVAVGVMFLHLREAIKRRSIEGMMDKDAGTILKRLITFSIFQAMKRLGLGPESVQPSTFGKPICSTVGPPNCFDAVSSGPAQKAEAMR